MKDSITKGTLISHFVTPTSAAGPMTSMDACAADAAPLSWSGPFAQVFIEKVLRERKDGTSHFKPKRPVSRDAFTSSTDSTNKGLCLNQHNAQHLLTNHHRHFRHIKEDGIPRNLAYSSAVRDGRHSVPVTSATPLVLNERAYILAAYLNSQAQEVKASDQAVSTTPKLTKQSSANSLRALSPRLSARTPPTHHAFPKWTLQSRQTTQQRYTTHFLESPTTPYKCKSTSLWQVISQRCTGSSQPIETTQSNYDEQERHLQTQSVKRDAGESVIQPPNTAYRPKSSGVHRTQSLKEGRSRVLSASCRRPSFVDNFNTADESDTTSENLWPSVADVERLNIGGLQYKPDSKLNSDSHKEQEEKLDENTKSSTKSCGVIIVPSHTMDNCPLCNIYYTNEDFLEGNKTGLSCNHHSSSSNVRTDEAGNLLARRKTIICSIKKSLSPTHYSGVKTECRLNPSPASKKHTLSVPTELVNNSHGQTVKLSYIRIT